MSLTPPTIHSLTFDCTGDPYDLGLFWSELLGRPLADDDKPGDPEALIADPAGGPRLLFVRVPEGRRSEDVTTATAKRPRLRPLLT